MAWTSGTDPKPSGVFDVVLNIISFSVNLQLIMCDPSTLISTYALSVIINPCNPGGSIGTYDQGGTVANDCLSRSGYKAKSSTWTFTTADIPELSGATTKGELNFYMEDGTGYAAFVQGAIVKTNNKIIGNIYQRNGNLTTFSASPVTGTATTITYTVTPAVSGYWTFRGV